MFKWISIIGLWLMALQGAAQTDSWQKDTLLVSLLAQQRFTESIPLLRNHLKSNPDNLDMLVKLAQIYHNAGQTAQSRLCWEQILEHDSSHQIALYQLAQIYQNEEDYLKAEAYIDRLVYLYPEHAHFLKTKAFIKSLRNNGIEAFNAYAAAHKINPADLDVITALAEIFHKNEQYQESDSLIAIGLSLDPLHFKLRKMQMEACYSLRYFSHTIELLEELKETPYFNNYFRRMLSICYIQYSRFEDALGVLQTIEDPDQNEEYTFFYLSKAYQGLGDKVLARHYIQKTLASCQHPNEGKYLAVLGNILIEAELYTLAGEAFAKSYLLQHDPMLSYWAGRSYDAGGKYDMAGFHYINFTRIKTEETDPEIVQFVEERLKTFNRKK